MTRVRRFSASAWLATILLVGCGTPPGQPRPGSIPVAPDDVVEFDALYSDNCAGCHGANGRGSAAIALASPVYLAIVDDDSLRAAIASGLRGTSMPAFAQRAGAMLTDNQIEALVRGIRSRFTLTGDVAAANPPSYTPTSVGDVHRGEMAYGTFCQRCHGADGRGGPHGGAITSDAFLALVSDRALRTMVIAGRPDLGAPDWRGNGNRPMSEQDVTDVVSWLASHRVAVPGDPHAE
jgi:mono/diheme cytochrome c family protein